MVITYLKDVNEASSRDIQTATGLRQPEVSIAVCTLRDMGWVTERKIAKDRKGRPRNSYALQPTMEEIIRYFEDQKAQEAARTREAFQRLKELAFA